jgi:mannose-6-phosphate isomerase-like protein (cupin superfamily)
MNALNIVVDSFLDRFLDRLHEVSGVDAVARAEMSALAAVWPARGGDVSKTAPDRLPACRHLDAALGLAASGPEHALAITIGALAPSLRWTYSYPPNAADRDLGSKVAFSQIVGSKGLVPSDKVHIGLTLLAPFVTYPAHAHPAVELYLVVGGTAAWQRGHESAIEWPPGSVIVHPSLVPHAMTTTDEPLLAIWTWRGDLLSPSRYLA